MTLLAVLLAVAALSTVIWSNFAAAAEQSCEREMARAAQSNDIPLNILYSVGLTESGRGGSLSPYDMNVDGHAVYSDTLVEALRRFQEATERGARFIDIGCMQINHHFHASRFRSVSEMFDPARNVDYAAAFLKTLRAEQGSWTMAVARYNSGPNNPQGQRTYVCSVIARMVMSGVGAWTPNARAFCR